MTTQERLKQAIEQYTVTFKNQKLLEDRFGKENLKNYPFRTITIVLGKSSSHGTEYFKLNLDTFKNEQYCSVGDYGEVAISDTLMERIEKEMFKLLGF
ncbi:hypothetical protein LEQ04_11895 [Riemerella anatipestifer]|uniref:hypothetical protein n=1 Tax=Riemerella anatipestifer TaxID=34085 RepID=UPI00129E025B|nr:hypothetical protein [Riemerella anatipestifer]MRM84798.1 hypothetical protein [Riemerella anatipestifer]WPC11284.1 hypothetical protein LEQ05_02610 [Riemerella anatipestifer]WPC13045.1 hypothetical protein LEQ03_13040 [Riemerella anatipestifer]WPC15142.1 hypothetical protein LEQ04_11895 [Riemerella anatipestifer]